MPPRFKPLAELGRVTQGATLSRYKSDEGTTYRIITISDLETLYVQQAQTRELLTSSAQQYQLIENDVVIAIRGTLLKSSVVTAALAGSISNQNTVFFRQQSEQINPLYLAVLLRSSYFDRLRTSALQESTTNLRGVKISDLRDLKIPLPSLSIQSEIAELFLDVEELKQVTLLEIESHQRISEIALLQTLEE